MSNDAAGTIHRPYYLDALARLRDTEGVVKVIVGVRRSGKTTLLHQYRDVLLRDGVAEASILHLDFESLSLSGLDSVQSLSRYLMTYAFPAGKRYVFLDEVHLIPEWEWVVSTLARDARYDVYLAGSNARALGPEHIPLPADQRAYIEVCPLSFAEYLLAIGPGTTSGSHPDTIADTPGQAYSDASSDVAAATAPPPGPDAGSAAAPSAAAGDAKAAFDAYLTRGGLPGQFDLRDGDAVRTQYIDGVLNTIVTKDIMSNWQVRDVGALLRVLRYLTAHTGDFITSKGTSDYLTDTGRRITADTVDTYLTLFEEAYLVYRAKREDLKVMTTLTTNDKFYVVDPGFRAVTGGANTPADTDRLLESVVYFELARRYGKVSAGKLGAEKVDFVVTAPSRGLAYFQVAQFMPDDAARQSQLRPLQAIRDSYPKTVLSLDKVHTPDYGGIRHVNLIDWLLEV